MSIGNGQWLMVWLPIPLEKRLKCTTAPPCCHPERSRGIYFVRRFARVAGTALLNLEGEIYFVRRFARVATRYARSE